MLAVAALSARALVELAALDGQRVVALDCFGDADTVQRAAHWLPIATPGRLEIDGETLLAALQRLALNGGVEGWIAGAGFDGRPELLQAGAERLPLIGTAGADLARLRDPRAFFGALDEAGIAHPELSFTPPADPAGWLRKDSGGSGGWHVQPASHDDRAAEPGCYWQRWRPGQPMSATLVANGRDAVVLGFNRQTVRPVAGRHWVFAGIVGPLPVPPTVERRLQHAAREITRRFALRGLASLDFLLDGEHAELLEANARPPASAELYPEVGAGGPLRAHLRAAIAGELPPAPPLARTVHGHEIVFARHALTLDAAAAARIAATPLARDLPRAGQHFDAGDPVCSLAAAGADAGVVLARLAFDREALLDFLENR
ncbi:hypothetical protein CLD22_06315 [Rubrivivax gelatinosus]|nr:hypothetical protein [Rubrivivax gelatinosus]